MQKRRRRWAPLLAAAVVHAALLAWMNLQVPRAPPLGEGRGIDVGLFDASALGRQPTTKAGEAVVEQTSPPEVEQTVEPIVPPPAPVEPIYTAASAVRFDADPVDIGPPTPAAAAPAAAGGGGPGETCALEERLQSMLQSDPAVLAAVARIPPESRSVANAVMLWDGNWVTPRASDTGPIRAAITRYVGAAPSNCREEEVRGPLLLAIAGEPRTTMLAIGSGVWRWSDLLREAAPRSPS